MKDGIMDCRNSHSWALKNLNEAKKTHFQHTFSVNISRIIVAGRLTGLLMFEHHITAERCLNFIGNCVPALLEDEALEVRHGLWFHCGDTPVNSLRCVRQQFQGHCIGQVGLQT